ncbi:unnamed protein product [Linum trigynum]|uniref:Uncharacterized protein n=1 Tax=Linum trigynum TaxID=586398 RepID=A0AAV2DBQ9_9ROSI
MGCQGGEEITVATSTGEGLQQPPPSNHSSGEAQWASEFLFAFMGEAQKLRCKDPPVNVKSPALDFRAGAQGFRVRFTGHNREHTSTCSTSPGSCCTAGPTLYFYCFTSRKTNDVVIL